MRRLKIREQNQGVVDTPQFPGLQKGKKTIEDVRKFIKDQVRRKGFYFVLGTSPQTFPLVISGTARFLYGITCAVDVAGACAISLSVNNEVVIENIDVKFLLNTNSQQEYFAVNRPLSGQDDVKLTIASSIAVANFPVQVVYK